MWFKKRDEREREMQRCVGLRVCNSRALSCVQEHGAALEAERRRHREELAALREAHAQAQAKARHSTARLVSAARHSYQVKRHTDQV